MSIRKLVYELDAQINNGEDIANQDAVNLFRWLDKNSAEWRRLTKRVASDDIQNGET